MKAARQDRSIHCHRSSRHATIEKREKPDDVSGHRVCSLSRAPASDITCEKKLKAQVDLTHLSNCMSQDSGPLSTSSSSKASSKSCEITTKPEEKAKNRRASSKCPYCPVIMTRSHDLRKHVEKLHQGPQEILCHICDYRATDIVLYLAHENDHLCKCPFCGFVAKNYRGLPRHKAFCHMNPSFHGGASAGDEKTQRRRCH